MCVQCILGVPVLEYTVQLARAGSHLKCTSLLSAKSHMNSSRRDVEAVPPPPGLLVTSCQGCQYALGGVCVVRLCRSSFVFRVARAGVFCVLPRASQAAACWAIFPPRSPWRRIRHQPAMFGKTLVFDASDEEEEQEHELGLDELGSTGPRSRRRSSAVESVRVASIAGAGGAPRRAVPLTPAAAAANTVPTLVDPVTDTSLCCRMFATEFVHINMRDAAEQKQGAADDIREHAPGVDPDKATQVAAREACQRRCRLNRGSALLLVFIKFATVAGWAVGSYYGVMCIEELFDTVSTRIDPPTTSRSYLGCACLFCFALAPGAAGAAAASGCWRCCSCLH